MITGLASLLIAAQGGLCPDANSTFEIIDCVNAAYRQADKRMTVEWKRTYSQMKQQDERETRRLPGPTYAQALLDSQRKWLAFRDSHCRVEGYRMRGGSGQGYTTTICLIDLTNDRTKALRRLAN